jgi:hypothetical protein
MQLKEENLMQFNPFAFFANPHDVVDTASRPYHYRRGDYDRRRKALRLRQAAELLLDDADNLTAEQLVTAKGAYQRAEAHLQAAGFDQDTQGPTRRKDAIVSLRQELARIAEHVEQFGHLLSAEELDHLTDEAHEIAAALEAAGDDPEADLDCEALLFPPQRN